MPVSPRTRTRLRISAIVIGIIAVIVVVASIFVDRYFQPLIKDEIKKAVNEGTDGLYKVTFSTLRFNVLTGNIRINEIHLEPDTAVYRRMQKAGTAPNNVYTVSVNRIELKGLRSIRLYRKREVKLSAIVVNDPSVKLVFERNHADDKNTGENRSLYERIKPVVRSIDVKRIRFRGVNFRYVDLSRKKTVENEFRNLSLNVERLLIDSVSDTKRRSAQFLYCQDIGIELNDYKANTPDSMYTYGFRRLTFSTRSKYLRITQLAFNPNYSRAEFSRKLPVQRDRYELHFDTVQLNDIDLHALNSYQHLRAKSLELAGGALNVYLNRNRPKSAQNKARNFPNVALQRLDFDLKMDTIKLNRFDVAYTELSDESQKRGTVSFKNLGGSIYNVTTSPFWLKRNPVARADLYCWLMGTGRLDVTIALSLTDPKGSFTYKGALGFMNLKVLNPIARPLGYVQISSGVINRLDFDMKGTVDGGTGTVTCRYNNLNITLLKKDNDTDQLIRRGLISMFANALVIEGDNPEPGQPVRVTHPVYERPEGSSFFNVMWKTIFLGVKEAAGITASKEDEIRRRINHFHQLQDRLEGDSSKKEIREHRKAERKQKRAIRRAARKENNGN